MGLRDCVEQRIQASKNLREAVKNGEITSDSVAVTNCLNCDWYGTDVELRPDRGDDPASWSVCPECGESDSLDSPEREDKLEVLQTFGYSYTELPQDIPNGEQEEFRI